MSDNQMMMIAREQAEKRIDAAIGELVKEAHRIADKYGFPEGVAGHSVGELLGRLTYVPSMARELRRQLGAALSKREIENVIYPQIQPDPPAPVSRETQPPANTVVPGNLDLSDVPGITVAVVKALKGAGLYNVTDVTRVPDEHLLKISGIAERSLQQLRASLAKLLAPQP